MSMPKLHRGWRLALLLIMLAFPVGVSAVDNSSRQPMPPAVRLVLARISPMIKAEDYPHAVEALKAFKARAESSGGTDGDHPEIGFALGNCYLMLEQHASAVAAYKRVVARDETHTAAWLNMAKACYELEQYADAGRAFEKGYATATEKSPQTLYYSAVAHMLAGNNARAVDLFRRLADAHPDALKPEWKENWVQSLLAMDRPRQALPLIRDLARVYTGEKKIQWQEILLYQYVQLDMPKAAIALAQRLTRQAPTVAKWWKALAHVQLSARKEAAALAALTIYSYLTPLSLDEKKLLADLNLQLGIPVKAAPLYEAYLKEKPNPRVLERLATAFQQMGRPETALARIDTLASRSHDPALQLLRGELLYELKRYDAAVVVYRQVARAKGRHAGRAWLMAGYAAWQMHDWAASKNAFAHAAEYKAEKRSATNALRQLAQQSAN
ncbi:tetratricopeptide repeat protein [Desulfosarcina ovata]|uniref:Tetratricopeptide repeat protein n=1 Tax=Desulfosarcina ovata subsp. ovata TaxID=2752305 RepID=A0A5K8AIW2_9BACT|nr:tetratricopeptide repeat protein [Desulfosarcina ovata]BBO92436.1 hypothetical protein DSCOOX_56160 [Desulfosarcina ovata subsp. ovata]